MVNIIGAVKENGFFWQIHFILKAIVVLDEERKAAMVSNLMVILCSDKDATPVVNAGTLSH